MTTSATPTTTLTPAEQHQRHPQHPECQHREPLVARSPATGEQDEDRPHEPCCGRDGLGCGYEREDDRGEEQGDDSHLQPGCAGIRLRTAGILLEGRAGRITAPPAVPSRPR